uniref:Uncharacterized protein DDB_G0274171-like n=1 Tax=Diabrotica virgifera virgifera TaxID=50390 RepID=A0A6P7F1Z8_DIAVI
MVYAQNCPPGPPFSCPGGAADCRLVKCSSPPTCNFGEKLGKLPGACCPRCVPNDCQLNCITVRCDFPACQIGTVSQKVYLYAQKCPIEGCPPGPSFSCPGEVDCSLLKCGRLPPCAEGEILGTLPGACCARCLPKGCQLNCDRVRCAFPACKKGFVAKQVFLYAQDCPPGPSFSCPGDADCKLVRCGALPTCGDGEILGTLPGACCPRCVPKDCELNCDAVRCAYPVCKKGTVPKQVYLYAVQCPPGPAYSCPGDADCTVVKCAAPPTCENGQILGTLPGACCPRCVPKDCELNCDAVRCAYPVCRRGTVPKQVYLFANSWKSTVATKLL